MLALRVACAVPVGTWGRRPLPLGSAATGCGSSPAEPARTSTGEHETGVRQGYGGCFSLSAHDRLYGGVWGPDRDGRAGEWTQSHGAVLF